MLPRHSGSTTPIKKFVLSERIMSKVVPGEVVPGEVVDVESPPAAVVDAQFESDDGREKEEAIAPVKPSNWTCSVCKRPNGAQTQECGVCGTHKDYQMRRRRRAEPIKVTQSIWDASAVATASRGKLRFMPFFEGVDLSKLALVRTLNGHSREVRCGVRCTFVMIWLRRRS